MRNPHDVRERVVPLRDPINRVIAFAPKFGQHPLELGAARFDRLHAISLQPEEGSANIVHACAWQVAVPRFETTA